MASEFEIWVCVISFECLICKFDEVKDEKGRSMTRKYVMFGLLLVVESMSAGVVLVIEANYCWPCDYEEC